MNELLQASILFFGGVVSIVLLWIGVKLFSVDRSEYKRNKSKSSSALKTFFGRIDTKCDNRRDHRVRAGLAFDIKNNEWIEQGTLSDEAIDSMLK